MNLPDLPIPEAGALLRAGTLSAVALTQAHLDRIRTHDPIVRAFVTVTEAEALAGASAADADLARGVDRGPLHGIPTALKDLIDTKGIRTTCGSRLREHFLPAQDAEVVRRLKQAGAIVLGKLATYEFALVGPSFDLPFPPAKNPWNPAHITGGSSSGCAAAVAGGLVRTSVGTDTGGSIRSPAGYCGMVGLKPTIGLVPGEGIFPLSQTLDHVGPISRTVTEAALTLDVLAQIAGKGSAARLLGRGIEGLRLAYARRWFADDPEIAPAVVAAMDDAASRLSLLGARIEEVFLPDYALFEACGSVILHAEALAIHAATLRSQGRDYGRAAFQTLAAGLGVTADDVLAARRVAGGLRETLDRDIFSRFDALLTVNTLTTAPPFCAFDGRSAVWTPMRTIPFNLTGHPVLALPVGFCAGLPIGMQIVGGMFAEADICRIGDAFEKATDFSTMNPPIGGMVQSANNPEDAGSYLDRGE